MDKLIKSVEVHLGCQGRLLLEKQEKIKQRLKNRFTKVSKDRSLADELIAERREAAKEEANK
jgi:hypothetical protein